MGIREYKPTSPARRFQKGHDFENLTSTPPEKSLVKAYRKTGGRNNLGRITVRHHGGGARRLYRIIDFKRDKLDIPAKVAAIHYDPNRSANIALLHYKDGEKRYILAPVGLQVGDIISAGEQAEIRPGNALKLKNIPVGVLIHNIEFRPGKGGQLVRAAGGMAQLMAKEGAYVQIKLPSGEVRTVHSECRATVGQVGNIEHENIVWGKAGRIRHLGVRPTVRGVAMNPIDHPHGGGEGKAKGGGQSRSPWGWQTKGYKTRKNKRTSKFILVDRRRKA